jgi:hypothetical protein
MSRGFILGLGLLAFAGVVGMAVWQVKLLENTGRPASDAATQVSPPGSSFDTAAKSPTATRALATPAATTNPPTFQWSQVEAEDYRAFLANLRKVGCPEQTVRDIVAADLVQSYRPKRHEALSNRYASFKYWSATPADSAARAELERKRREVDEEMTWAMRELLGQDFIPPSTAQEWKLAELDQQLAGLTPEKRQAVKSLLIQYADTDQQVRALASGQNLSENLAERTLVLEEYDRKRAELQRLLNPEEFHEMEMTTSWTADNLRRGAAGFNPSAVEFQILFQEWQAYDEMLARLRASGQPDPGSLQEPMQENLRLRLGEQRAQEFWSTWWQ